MAEARTPAHAFFEAWQARPASGNEPASSLAEVDRALVGAAAEARAAWPEVAVPPLLFARWLGERASREMPALDALGLLKVTDLYLACGCVRGETAAVRALDAKIEEEVRAAVRQLKGPDTLAEEIGQVLRERLLVAVGESPARIVEYAGRGPIGAWLRVAAVRAAISVLRKGRGAGPTSDEKLLNVAAPGDDPEMEHLKTKYRDDFRRAFLDAIAALSVRERNLLRHHFTYGMTVVEVGALYRVHHATAARWINKARDRLAAETRRLLGERLQVARTELDSIYRLIQSRIDLSLGDFLGSVSDTPRPRAS